MLKIEVSSPSTLVRDYLAQVHSMGSGGFSIAEFWGHAHVRVRNASDLNEKSWRAVVKSESDCLTHFAPEISFIRVT